MDAGQLRTTLDRLGLSTVDAARFLGVDRRTIHFWLHGRNIPEHVRILLLLMARYRIVPNEARVVAGLPPIEKPRRGRVPGTRIKKPDTVPASES